jgi:hypothetical protein
MQINAEPDVRRIPFYGDGGVATRFQSVVMLILSPGTIAVLNGVGQASSMIRKCCATRSTLTTVA